MNLENLNKAIAVMERVRDRGDAFNLRNWQGRYAKDWSNFDPVRTEEELHTCGTPACFAGWLAVSPEWAASGGTIGTVGEPEINHLDEDDAIAFWLRIDEHEAGSLCGVTFPHLTYGKTSSEVTVDDVLTALYRLRDTGSVFIDGAQS